MPAGPRPPPGSGQPVRRDLSRRPSAKWRAHRREFVARRRHSLPYQDPALEFYPVWVLELGGVDVEAIATALSDQIDYEHGWLLDPRTGQVAF